MNIIIEHKGVKRSIDGSFNICGSKEDLFFIAEKIDRKLENSFNYGWVTIPDEEIGKPNSLVIGWKEDVK